MRESDSRLFCAPPVHSGADGLVWSRTVTKDSYKATVGAGKISWAQPCTHFLKISPYKLTHAKSISTKTKRLGQC